MKSILRNSLIVKNSENLAKDVTFKKPLRWTAQFLLGIGDKVSCVKHQYFGYFYLLGGQCLFDRCHSSSTIETSKNILKSW